MAKRKKKSTTADLRQIKDLRMQLERMIRQVRSVWDDQVAVVNDIERQRASMVGELPSDIRKNLQKVFDEFLPLADCDDAIRHAAVSHRSELAIRSVRAAAEIGFFAAVVRYKKWLHGNSEVKRILAGRMTGLRKGHVKQTQAREAQHQRIRDKRAELEAAGEPCTYDVIATLMECSRSTVERAINNRTTKRPKR